MESKRAKDVPKKNIQNKHTSKRMSSIFRSMSNMNRIEILRVLYSKGSVTYTDLKDYAGFATKKESGKFAYHLRDLIKLALVEKNKSERRYNITNQGKLVLDLADRIESNVFMESGKLQVRSSNSSISEFKKQRIVQSLVKEANMPYELAEKITKDVENKIHKYEISYITGSLIRDMVNFVLLEAGHEEYRSKLVRLGMPIYDVQKMLANPQNMDGGIDDAIAHAGHGVFVENVIFGTMQKDTVDRYMAGLIHISNLGTWPTLPDVLFVNIKDILDKGMDIGGRYSFASRISKLSHLEDVSSSLSVMMQIFSKEVSDEVVISGLPQLLAKRCEDRSDEEIKQGIVRALVTSSVAASSYVSTADDASLPPPPRHHTTHGEDNAGKTTSIRINLGLDARLERCIVGAYLEYVKMTPRPRVGLVIGYDKDGIESVSSLVSEAVLLGGRILFTKSPQVSSRGVAGGSLSKADSSLSMALQSISINLPNLAREIGDGDVDYFMARLVLMLKPIITSLVMRKKDVFDATRRGLNPQIARHTNQMQHGYASMTINLVGLKEAVFEILGFSYNRKGREAVQNILNYAVHAGTNYAKDYGERVDICMADSDGADRFAKLDGKKYGKHVVGHGDAVPYSQGLNFDASKLASYTNKSPSITLCNKINRTLNAGLQVRLMVPKNETDPAAVKKMIEKMATLIPTFIPTKPITICPECGFKEKPFDKKCPKCQAPLRSV